MRLVVAGKTARSKRKSLAGQLVLVLLGLQLMFVTSFAAIDLPTGTGRNLIHAAHHSFALALSALPETLRKRLNCSYLISKDDDKPIRFSLYTPEIPVAVFLGYVLGRSLAPVVIALFVGMGLFGPLFGIHPFAGGGGFDYYSQPGFGYLLGMIAGSYSVGWITAERRSSFSQLAALVAGIVSIHVIGLAYLISSCLIFCIVQGVHHGPLWLPWVFELTAISPGILCHTTSFLD